MRMPRLIFLSLFTAAMAAAPRLSAQGALERVFPERFGRWNVVSSPVRIKTDEGRA